MEMKKEARVDRHCHRNRESMDFQPIITVINRLNDKPFFSLNLKLTGIRSRL